MMVAVGIGCQKYLNSRNASNLCVKLNKKDLSVVTDRLADRFSLTIFILSYLALIPPHTTHINNDGDHEQF